MDTTIRIPIQALHYILLQRTGYQTRTLSRLLRHLPGMPSLIFSKLEALLRKKHITSCFQRGILGDYNSIKEDLPLDASLILDIGCGVAGIDILLYRHYARHNPPQIYLADLSETSPVIRYDFSSSPAIYNSFEVAISLLSMNGIPMGLIHIINAQQLTLLDMAGKFNLVISTLAWGFHFPVPTYLDTVYRLLAHSGRLIMDIRSGTDGIDYLRTTFRSVDILSQNETKARVVAIK